MKKRVLQICLTIIYLFVLCCCTSNKNELRLKINANSNSIEDQNIKIDIKEYLIRYLSKIDIKDLNLEVLENNLNKEFINLKIKVERTKVSFEAKSYEGKIIPSGKYDTILITIGKGEGKNFWTLLYPEFFNICFEDEHEIEYRSYFYDLFN